MPGRIRCLLPNPNSDTTIFFQPPENAYKALNLNLMHLPIPPLQNRASGFSEPFSYGFGNTWRQYRAWPSITLSNSRTRFLFEVSCSSVHSRLS